MDTQLLAQDELATIFSFLKPQENITSLNLVCRDWYNTSSVTQEQASNEMWKVWYAETLKFFVTRDIIPVSKTFRYYKKLAKPIETRNRQMLMRRSIEFYFRYKKAIHDREFKKALHMLDNQYPMYGHSLKTIEFVGNELITRFKLYLDSLEDYLQTLDGKLLMNRFLKLNAPDFLPRDENLGKRWIDKLVGLGVTILDEDAIKEVWNRRTSWWHFIRNGACLPTQICIHKICFNDAKYLIEEYLCPTIFDVPGTEYKITSLNVLLMYSFTGKYSFSSSNEWYSRLNIFDPERCIDMIKYLLEKEGRDHVMYDLSVTNSSKMFDRSFTPLTLLVKGFYTSKYVVPLVDALIELGFDVNERDADGYSPLMTFVEETGNRQFNYYDLNTGTELLTLLHKHGAILDLYNHKTGTTIESHNITNDGAWLKLTIN